MADFNTIQNMAQQFMGAGANSPNPGAIKPPQMPQPAQSAPGAQPALNNASQYGQNTTPNVMAPGGVNATPVGYSAPQQVPGAPGVAQGNYIPGQINIGQPASIDMGQMLQQMLRGAGVGLGASRPGVGAGQVTAQMQGNIPGLIQMLISHLQAQNALGQMSGAAPGQVSAWV